MTRLLTGPIVVIALIAISASASADEAAKGSIVGTWKMISLTRAGKTKKVPPGYSVTLRFTSKGTYMLTTKKPEGKERTITGAYKLEATTLLITTGDKRKEQAKVEFSKKGSVVRLIGKGDVALLHRVPTKR